MISGVEEGFLYTYRLVRTWTNVLQRYGIVESCTVQILSAVLSVAARPVLQPLKEAVSTLMSVLSTLRAPTTPYVLILKEVSYVSKDVRNIRYKLIIFFDILILVRRRVPG